MLKKNSFMGYIVKALKEVSPDQKLELFYVIWTVLKMKNKKKIPKKLGRKSSRKEEKGDP